MKTKELTQMSELELNEKLIELRKDIMKDNAQIALGTNPKSPGKLKQSKKAVAKILTILNQKRDAKKQEGKK